MTDAISWRNPQVLRVLALVFVAGALSGAVTYRVARRITAGYTSNPPAPATPPTAIGGKDTLGYLKKELNLSPDQTERVSSIIDDYRHYYGNIQDQYEEVRATGKNRILQVLDPEQRLKFEKLPLK